MVIDRRRFLAGSGSAVGAVFTTDLWSRALAQELTVGAGPYGPLRKPDANGLRLPEGFTSRVVARSQQPVGPDRFVWPRYPDGAATFDDGEGGWYHVVNSEVFAPAEGAVSTLRYDASGEVVDAYSLLTGTEANCAGGPTPWGTWLSGEEFEDSSAVAGLIWECDPTVPDSGEARPALGAFIHEAAAVDPGGERVYLTEDHAEGGFYRFTPDAYPDLGAGLLEIASLADDDTVAWSEVPDPSAESGPCRRQVADSAAFNRSEGCWYDRGVVYFSTTGDDRIWSHDIEAGTITVLYDAEAVPDTPLRGIDNLVVEPGSGDLLAAEDGGDMQIVLITAEGDVTPLVQIADEPLPDPAIPSEVTGPVFSPDGTRLYFSSQRGGPEQFGITYEVTGPFRGPALAAEEAATTTTVLEAAAGGESDDDDGSNVVPIAVGVGGAVGVGIGATIALRRRGAAAGDGQ